MPKYFEKLPEAAFGGGVVKAVKKRVKGAVGSVISDVKDVAQDFTSYPTEGFRPIHTPHDLLTNILEGVRTGTEKGAEVTGDIGSVIGRRVAQNLVAPVAGPAIIGEQFVPEKYRVAGRTMRTAGRTGSVLGRTGGVAAPYVAGSLLAPEAVAPYVGAVLTGQMLALAGSAADRYERGQLSGKQAIFEIAVNAGPLALGPALRGLRGAGRALGAFAETPEGQQAIKEAVGDTGLADVGGLPKRKTRLGNMRPDERSQVAQPVSSDTFVAGAKRSIEQSQKRIGFLEERLKNPLQERPEGKTGGVYASDLLTVDGNRYPIHVLQADAGESTVAPVISTGKYTLKGVTKSGKPRTVAISIQEAEVLSDLYRENPEPSVTQVRKALQSVSGRTPHAVPEAATGLRSRFNPIYSPAKGQLSATFELGPYTVDVDAAVADRLSVAFEGKEGVTGKITDLRQVAEFIADLAANNPDRMIVASPADARLSRIYKKLGFVKVEGESGLLRLDVEQFTTATGTKIPSKTTGSAAVSSSRARLVREYIEAHAPRVERPITRPTPEGTPAFRQAKRSLDMVNGEIYRATTRIDELERLIANDRRRLEAYNKAVTPSEEYTRKLGDLEAQIKSVRADIAKAGSTAEANTLKEEFGKLLAQRDFLESTKVTTKVNVSPQQIAAIRNRLSQNEEAWRQFTSAREAMLARRATELDMPLADVPLDPHEQTNILLQKHGSPVDQLPVLPPSRAQEVLNNYRTHLQETITELNQRLANHRAKIVDQEALVKAVEDGVTGGRVPAPGNFGEAARRLRKWLNMLDLRNKNPGGIHQFQTGVEALTNYAKLAMIDAYHGSMGIKNPGEQAKQVWRDLASKLVYASSRTEGPGGHAFIIQDGEKVYGSIRSVQPAAVNPDEWLVDFVPDFTPTRGVIPNIRVKDVNLEYKNTDKFNAVNRRYEHERDIIANVRSEEQMRVAGTPADIAASQRMAQMRQEQMAGLKPLTVTEADIRTPEQLNAEVAAAWDSFEKVLMPLAPDAGPTATTQARLIHDGFMDTLNSPLPRNKFRAENAIQARRSIIQPWREYIADTTGIALDDPGLKDLIDEGGDPVFHAMYLRGRSIDPEDIVREPSITNVLGRRTRGALDFVLGRTMPDMRVRGINTGYHYARKGASANIWRNFNGLTQQWRKLAIKTLAESGDGRMALRPKSLRFSYGDSELQAVLHQHFDPTPKPSWTPELTAAMNDINKLPDEIKTQLLDKISREHRWAMDYPELFPTLPDDFKQVGSYGRAIIKRLSDIAALDTGSSVSNGYLNRLMIDPSLRDQIHADLINEGHPLSVLAAAAQISHNLGRSLNEMIVTGDDLLRAEPLAYWNSSIMQRVTNQVKALADPAETITEGVGGDITHLPGRWSIKSLDKWKVRTPDGGVDWAATRDLQTSLKQLEQGLNRLPDWKGLSKLSQSIANMVLTLDANILSVQGYSAISSKAVYDLATIASGKPIKGANSMAKYVGDLHSVMSDEGFHAWYRTRADDIQYYSSLGMSIGQEAFTAGPRMNKLPFEDLPFVGLLPKTAREFNDLQFNRLLLYLKTTAIDQQIAKASLFRRLGPTSSQAWLKLPGIKSVVEESAGESAYLHGQPESVVKAAIRATNNKLGGIDLNAQGISQWRQTAEQIMTITPGFFRAQAGMLNTALTRPHTVEGWMAITGIAEEVMFAAGVATLLAAATGNTDKLNLTDITRADWMAVPFDNSYIPIIPRVGIPRLAARVLKASVDAGQGEGFNAGPAIQSFAQGRLSPFINATLGPAFFDEDFIGRRYRDKKDRVFASLTSFMSIFIENLATDARENVAQDGWGALTPLSYQTPLQFAGKNLVPRPPIDKLDEFAKQYTSESTPKAVRGWYDLTSQEQEQLLQNPKIKAAKDDLDYYQQRRASPKEQQIEAQFQMADERTNALRTQPVRFPDGVVASIPDLYDLLVSGQIDGDEYRKKLQYVNGRISEVMDSMETSLKSLGFDLSQKHEDRIKRLRKVFAGADENAVMTQLAIWDSEQIQPDNYTHEVTVQTSDGPVTMMETDWDAYQHDKDAVWAKYPDNVRISAQQATDKWNDEGVAAYREAAKKRSQIEDLPRYRGFTNDQADKIDAMTKSFRDLSDVVRAKIGLPGSLAPLPKGLSAQLRAYAVKQFAAQGFLKTKDDIKLAAVAIMLQEEPLLREALRGPEQISALIKNPDVLLFYPYLMGRVPVWMRNRLPESLRPQFDINERYARIAG